MSKYKKFTEIANYTFELLTCEELKDLSLEALVVYSTCVRRNNFSIVNNIRDENGNFYATYPMSMVERDIRSTRNTARKVLRELIEKGLVEVEEVSGKPSRLYVYDYAHKESES